MRVGNRMLVGLALLAAPVIVAGCGSSSDAPGPVAVAADTTPRSAPAARAQDELKEPVAAEAVSNYAPPFPKRLNPFEPKRRKKIVRQTPKRDGESVVLKGFATVEGQQQVLLAIDGVVMPLRVGDQRSGMQVVSIQDPEVELKRGDDNWTITLQ